MNSLLARSELDLPGIYLRNFIRILTEGLNTDDDRIKAFYYLVKYIKSNKDLSEKDVQLTFVENLLLAGVSTQKFMTYFPAEKVYDGHKWQTKDYFSTIEMVKQQGDTIKDVQEFLWDYQNLIITHYTVQKMCALSKVREQQTGMSMIEEIFGIKPKYLREVNSKKFLYDSETGKMVPVKERKRRPKWIKLVK